MKRLFLRTYVGIAGIILLAATGVVLLVGWTIVTGLETHMSNIFGPSAKLLAHRLDASRDPEVELEIAEQEMEMPLEIIHGMPDVAARHQARLAQGELSIIVQPWRSGPLAYLPLSGRYAGHYLKLGPAERAIGGLLGPATASLFLVLVLLGVGIYSRLRPIQRQLGELTVAAERLGRGEWETRVTLPPEAAFATLGNTFNQMAARISALVDGQQELLHAVAHELRTPLARLRFALAMLDDTENSEERVSRQRAIEQDLQELDELVGELLTYARLQEGGPPLEYAEVDVGHLVQDLRPGEAEARGIDYRVACEPDIHRLAIVDGRLIQRALINVVNNAVRYAQSTVRVSARDRGDWLEIDIDDDGPGIPEAERQRIFAPFARLDSSRTSSTGGTGLGLAIVARIIQWHHGGITVSASPLGGARFRLRIRREPPAGVKRGATLDSTQEIPSLDGILSQIQIGGDDRKRSSQRSKGDSR